ncbi:DUF1403 family protein [Mesorhizobium sp. M0239]
MALATTAVTAKQSGRVEDQAALRDALLLTRPGDEVGPAGRMAVGLASADSPARPVSSDGEKPRREEVGYHRGDETVGDLAGNLRQLGAGVGTVATLTGARRSLSKTFCRTFSTHLYG